MEYNIGDTVYTISSIGYMKEHTIIGKIDYKIFGFTYKTKYVCELLRHKEKWAFSRRKIHRIEK